MFPDYFIPKYNLVFFINKVIIISKHETTSTIPVHIVVIVYTRADIKIKLWNNIKAIHTHFFFNHVHKTKMNGKTE